MYCKFIVDLFWKAENLFFYLWSFQSKNTRRIHNQDNQDIPQAGTEMFGEELAAQKVWAGTDSTGRG